MDVDFKFDGECVGDVVELTLSDIGIRVGHGSMVFVKILRVVKNPNENSALMLTNNTI